MNASVKQLWLKLTLGPGTIRLQRIFMIEINKNPRVSSPISIPTISIKQTPSALIFVPPHPLFNRHVQFGIGVIVSLDIVIQVRKPSKREKDGEGGGNDFGRERRRGSGANDMEID